MKRIYNVYRPLHKALGISIAFDCLQQASSLIAPFLSGMLVDGIINKQSLSEQAWVITAVFVSMEFRGALYCLLDIHYLRKILFDSGEVASETTLSNITKLSIGQIVNHNSGFKDDVIKKGEIAIADTVNLLLTQVISNVLRVLIASFALFFLSFWMGVVTLVFISLYVVSSYIINIQLKPAMKKHYKLENKLGTAYWERIRNLRLVMVTGQEERMKKESAADEKECNAIGRTLWVTYVKRIHYFREPFSHIGQVGVLIVAAHLTSSGQATIGSVVIAIGWSTQAFSALGMVGSLQRQLAKNLVIIGRYFDLIDMPPAIRNVNEPIRPKRFRGDIEFRNVSFVYPELKPSAIDTEDDEADAEKSTEKPTAIKNVSFRIRAGTTCALVGPSGSGKTTTVSLILRYYDPDSGEVLIDGHELPKLDLHHWRTSVGTVEQDPKLWDNTVRYNITYGLNGRAEKVTEDELEKVSRIARIDEFYPRLGQRRFDTVIGENGVQLSGGQRQRIAVARALIKNPDLVILDEATNALDPENEALVHQAMKEALKGRTGIIIAHRLSTVRHADQIIVFKSGGIAGNGNHEELMASCEEYRNLVLRETSMFV
jgi:ATP-binding cassette, subfamily B, bacterial